MVHKKKWLTITVLVAALVIVIGTVGGIAYAQTGITTTNSTPEDPATTLYAKVAAILGIDQQKLEAAFAQAQKEMRNEELTNRLNNMVEQGAITQSQADEYLTWWQARPDITLGAGFGGGPGIPGGPRGMIGPGGNLITPPADTNTTTE